MQLVRVRMTEAGGDGCEQAPVKVVEALKKIEMNEQGHSIIFDRLHLEEIHVDLEKEEESHHLIYQNSVEIFEKNDRAFFIGGDHSISYSLGRAFLKVEDNPLLIVFDAFCGCVDGERISQMNWLRRLVKEGFGQVILVSARFFTEEELAFLRSENITFIRMDVLYEDFQGVCDMIMERARSSSGFFISFSVRAVDPAFAPGVSRASPGGISSRDALIFLKRLSMVDTFRGGAVVDINPSQDFNNVTVELGARLLVEMM